MLTIVLPYTRPPLSLNDRGHWRAKAATTKRVRLDVATLARAAHIPPMDRATVTFVYQPRDRRRRDADNLFASLKPCLDGLRDAGVIPDDDHETVTPRVRIEAPAGAGRCWLEVSAL